MTPPPVRNDRSAIGRNRGRIGGGVRRGFVSLVGAGPGDPELLTVKALRRLREADIVIYDTLANPEHLRHMKKGAKALCVGRGFRHKKVSQDKINRMIVAAAARGRKVVRLKGGDPYLFGRGGEEALFLVRHGIPFEVVPGVTSATGCAAYAGIPLTHREHNASVTFLTGHRAEDASLDAVDWQRIASLEGTIVIYMGFYNLAKISEKLLSHGMRADTPTAVVEWGTLPRQRSCASTLQDIPGEVEAHGFQAPCLIIIGGVVNLRKELNWFESLPLFGKKVLVARPADKISSLADKFRALGAGVVEWPVIEIQRKPDEKALGRAISGLSSYDWIVFTSTYGVEAFFDALARRGKDSRALQGIRIAGVGSETGSALLRNGVKADLQPKNYETKALSQAFRKMKMKGKRVLLLRTNIAPPDLEKDLRSFGAHPERVTAYRTVGVKIPKDSVKELLEKPADFVAFTSSSTVENFVRALGAKDLKRLSGRSRFASIGPVTSRTMKKKGLRVACQAKIFNTDGLVEAVRRSVR